jgi:CBS domain-containing protein
MLVAVREVGAMLRKLIPDVVQHQDVAALTGSATVREAAALMRSRHIGSVLIVGKDGKLEGIFTERDVVCRVVADCKDPDRTKLHTVMTAGPETASPSTTAIDALRRMHDGGFRHLPVVQNGKPVAVVSRRDFFGAEKARIDQENDIWEHIR